MLNSDFLHFRITNGEKYLYAYLKLTMGDSTRDVRAKMESSGLSVEQQVACLIDLATDTSILGITYAGFEPWT